jgi:REP element-mobilizing transposase RayT
MPRKNRVHVAGGLYHVILRGNNRQQIFVDNRARARFLDLLSEGVPRFGYKVHAFCLMSNHVHLALQAGDEPIAKAVQNVGFRHAQRTHWASGSSGHIFQGRYKAILAGDTAYVLELVRYIHRNPVEAGLVESPSDWRWSSHGAYLGVNSWSFLTTSWVLEMLDEDPVRARRRYLELVTTENPPSPADDSPVLSSGNLNELILRVCQVFETTPERVAAPKRTRLEAEVRSVVLRVALDLGIASLTEIGRAFRRAPSGLCHGQHRLRSRMTSDPELARRVGALLGELTIGD